MRWLIGMVAACLLAGGTASAQDSGPSNDEVGRRAFVQGREAFAAGDYETALIRFREAYELSHRAGLLYNIAQSLDRLRRDEEALRALREYLEAVPNSRSRAEVEARIRVLERTLADREREEEERGRDTNTVAPPPVDDGEDHEEQPPAPPARPPLHPAVFIATGAVALAGAGVSIWTGLETIDEHDAYRASTDLETAQRHYDRGNSFQTATNVLIFSSAAIGAAAIVMLFFTDWGGEAALGEETAPVAWMPTLQLGPDGATVGAIGRF